MKTKKKVKKKHQPMTSFGIIFMALGAGFLTAVDKPLGAAFLILGALFFFVGLKNKE